MKTFTENTRVQVPAALHLCRLGYTYLDNITDYEKNTNILTDVFKRSMKRLNPDMDDMAIQQLLDKIVVVLKNDDLGMEFYRMLVADNGVRLVDFRNPDNNEWHVTTELPCENQETKDTFRPDITCFINGLPLSFIEVKKPNNHDGILAERDRINVRMKNKQFRRFINISQLMIFSNNQEYDNENRVPIQGAFYCTASKSKAFFSVFREEQEGFVETYPYRNLSLEEEKKVLVHRNCVIISTLPDYETNKEPNTPTNRILTSMLCKERILFLLKYGIAYVNKNVEVEDGTKTTRLEKHIMRYQQMFASMSIRKNLEKGVKSGIIWHTQGSGKTALAYYNVKHLTDYYASHDTVAKFYFIVDRLALLEQACDEFSARGLSVKTANSREELMKDFRSTAVVDNKEGKLEIMVVNIQKFKEDNEKIELGSQYNTNLQRVFFIDEAHRGYNPKGSFLANLLNADQNAVKIALTGTPLLREERESWRVFGDYIDTYYYDKSISDGYTLKLMREPIETVYKEKIENILEKLAGDVEVKSRDIDRDKIIENENYLNALLDYIITDFRRFRLEQGDNTVGAMIVCKTNPQAREMYRLWQERFSVAVEDEKAQSDQKPKDSMLSAPKKNRPLVASLILHDEGDKEERKAYIDEFKKKMTVDVLIVNQMLLTGFDAPRLKKMYLGRKLDGHDLLQTLTRVNRPYKDFRYGYVVDFAGIKENFEETNNRYLRELNRTTDPQLMEEYEPVGNAIIESKEEILAQMKEIKSALFLYTCDNPEEFRKELDDISEKEKLYELRNALDNAKAIVNQVRSFGDDELKSKIGDLGTTPLPTLINEVTHRIERINLIDDLEHTADVSGIINIALSELEFEFHKGMPEELRIVINTLQERCERVQILFDANFDKVEPKFVILADEFRKYFRKKGFVPQNVQEAEESIKFMDEVTAKIQEINKKNEILKKKYKGDERFVRIHKRIEEANEGRETPLISSQEFEVAEELSAIKEAVDRMIFLNSNVVDNEESFRKDVLALIGKKLIAMGVKMPLQDRKYVNNLITSEYIEQRNQIQL